jgi:hypothetical protein
MFILPYFITKHDPELASENKFNFTRTKMDVPLFP